MSKISVIIPVYNVEKYLPQCLESILNQTFTDFEVIAVDDGSTDNSLRICREFAEKDARIQVIHQENGGASKARNAGIDVAKGDYISFVDGDDFLKNNFLEKLYGSICEEKTAMSICGMICVDEMGQPIPSLFSCNMIPVSISGRDAVANIGNNVAFGVVWNKLYRKELFHHIKFTEGRTFEDELILHHLYHECNSIVCVPEVLYYYVQRPDSKMKEPYSPAKMDVIYAYIDRVAFLIANDYNADLIARVHRKLLEYFRYAFIYGRRNDEGQKKLKGLYKDYTQKIYGKLPRQTMDFNTRLFSKAPVMAAYLMSAENKWKYFTDKVN